MSRNTITFYRALLLAGALGALAVGTAPAAPRGGARMVSGMRMGSGMRRVSPMRMGSPTRMVSRTRMVSPVRMRSSVRMRSRTGLHSGFRNDRFRNDRFRNDRFRNDRRFRGSRGSGFSPNTSGLGYLSSGYGGGSLDSGGGGLYSGGGALYSGGSSPYSGGGSPYSAYSMVSGSEEDDSALDDTADVTVKLPADAELWFDDVKQKPTGRVRLFVTPELKADREYTYEVRARWRENGREVTQTRKAVVTAGADVEVDFPSASVLPKPH
jgi:uncharacterized protein (TIGR03000 family)